MANKLSKILLSLITFLLLTVSGLLAQNEQDAYRVENFSSSDSPSVNIRTSGGSVKVFGHDRDEVKVLMYVRRGGSYLFPSDTDLSDFEIDISKSGDRIDASAKREGNGFNIFRGGRSISISFEVYAPTGSVVEGRTSGGSVYGENIHNDLILRTSGGRVTAKNSSGNIVLNTSGGSLNMEDLEGNISARTSGGSVNADRLNGTAELRTSGGSINIRESAGKISATTSGGSIRAGFTEFNEDIELRTSGGSITINIPPVDNFEMDLTAQRVQTELRNFTGESNRNSIQGRVGDGGPKISARTSGGRVTLTYD